ncbi:MAG: flagellar motor protein MotB, partial [Candidatus Omnitrophota bacterium]
SADASGDRSLVRQQSATMESLKEEILRLNQELDGTPGLREDLQTALPKIEKVFASQIERGDVGVILDRRGLVLTVQDHALFDTEGAQFTSAGEEVLEKVSTLLVSDLPKNRVIVEGHTDDQPIENADEVTNWEYSIGRATAILHYLIDVKELSPGRFGVAGFAEYRPVTSNDTEEGRDRNRRVEIVISPERSFDASSR